MNGCAAFSVTNGSTLKAIMPTNAKGWSHIPKQRPPQCVVTQIDFWVPFYFCCVSGSITHTPPCPMSSNQSWGLSILYHNADPWSDFWSVWCWGLNSRPLTRYRVPSRGAYLPSHNIFLQTNFRDYMVIHTCISSIWELKQEDGKFISSLRLWVRRN